MIFFTEITRAPSFEFNGPIPQMVVEAEYEGRQTPTQECFQEFTFDQTIIPLEGGQQSLRLQKPLRLHINPETLRFTVKDWGIEMDCLHLAQLPREVTRKFLNLLSAAENELLSETEQADWLRISDYIDYQRFCIDRSPPHYVEGTLRSNASLTIVEWSDGTRETLNRKAARALSEVNVGERFSAFVKLGKDNEALSIERVSLLRPLHEQEDWESWPTKS